MAPNLDHDDDDDGDYDYDYEYGDYDDDDEDSDDDDDAQFRDLFSEFKAVGGFSSKFFFTNIPCTNVPI